MRDAFIRELTKRAQKNPDIYLLTGDLGFSVFEDFAKRFPKRFINAGIAEANMIGVASGLALSGKVSLVYSIIPFCTLRPIEQIKVDVCYQNTNVKIVGVGSGYSYGTLGITHHAIEDIGALRSFPNLRILSPCDSFETEACLELALKTHGPFYLRLGKNKDPKVHHNSITAKLGSSNLLKEGTDLAILSTGSITYNALQAAEILEKEGLHCRVVSMYSIKPIDERIILDSAKKCTKIVVVEEHNIIGGLGSAVSEVLAEKTLGRVNFRRIGIKDKFCEDLGSRDYLLEKNNLSAERIVEQIQEFLKEK